MKKSKFLLLLTVVASTLGIFGCEKTGIPTELPSELPTEVPTKPSEPTEPVEEKWTIQSQTEPTCTEEGQIVYVSSTTGETKTETIPALGHKITTSTKVDELLADVESSLCSVCGFEECVVKFTDNTTGIVTYDKDSKIVSFNYEANNVKINFSEGNWTLTVGEVVAPITFAENTLSLSMIYKIVDLLPELGNNTTLSISVEENILDGNRMGVYADIYRIIYTLGEESYKYNVLRDSYEGVMLQYGAPDGMNEFHTMDGTLICSIKTVEKPSDGNNVKVVNHYDADGNIVNIRKVKDGITYYYEADGTTLIKANKNDNTVFYDAYMNEIAEAEWNMIALKYSFLWNQAWAQYGKFETDYNGGKLSYSLTPDSAINTFEYVKDDTKLIYVDNSWILSVGDIQTPITFVNGLFSVRLIYKVIDHLPELKDNKTLSISVEENTLDGSRMGNTAYVYRIIYTLDEDSYKYDILRNTYETVMLQYGAPDGMNKFYTMDGTLICSIKTVEKTSDGNNRKVVNHYDAEGNIINVRIEQDGIVYYYEADGETLVKANKKNVREYLNHDMNNISEAEWNAIPLEYSYLWNSAWAEYTEVNFEHFEGSVKYTLNENSTVNTFEYVKGNVKVLCADGAWTLTVGDVVAPISFEDEKLALRAIYKIIDNLPALDGNTSLTISFEEITIGNNRMGTSIPGYRITYEAKGGNEFSYKPCLLKDTLECILIQIDKDGKTSYYQPGCEDPVYYTTSIKESGKTTYNHYGPDGTLLDVRVKENGIVYLYYSDGVTLQKAHMTDNSVYYDGNMNEITEAEWYAIPLQYSYLWNAAWGYYGNVETTYNGGKVEYTFDVFSEIKTFEYVKDDVKVTFVDEVWTLSVGDIQTTLNLEKNLTALRMVYRIIDNLPELKDSKTLSISVEENTLDGSRMGNTAYVYRIIYTLDEESYKYSVLRNTYETIMLQYGAPDGMNEFHTMDGTLICSIKTVEKTSDGNNRKVVNHYDAEGNIVNVRIERDGITYYYEADGETLVKANKNDGTAYFDRNMNYLSRAEWNAIPLNYSYLWNSAWAEYTQVVVYHLEGRVVYTLNSDSTVNTFMYKDSEVMVTCADGVWTLTVGDVVAPITFEDEKIALRAIYKIIDNLPELEDSKTLSISVEETTLDGSRMGNTANVYRIIYTLDEESYKYSVLRNTYETIMLQYGAPDGMNDFYTMDGTLICSIKTVEKTSDGNNRKVVNHYDAEGNIVNVRIEQDGITYYYEADGETLVKANDTDNSVYYDGNMNEITEAEWSAIPLNYSTLWVKGWGSFSKAQFDYKEGKIEYTLNPDGSIKKFDFTRFDDKVIFDGENWIISPDGLASVIAFEEGTYSLRLIYRIIDSLPYLGDASACTVVVENNLLDGSRMGTTTDIYRIIYTVTSDIERSYKYSVLKSNFQNILVHVGFEGKNNFFTPMGVSISSINTTVLEDEEGNSIIYREHCNDKNQVINVRVLYQGCTSYYEADGKTLIKAEKDGIYFNKNMEIISEAEWYAIPLDYSYIWNEYFAEYGVVCTDYKDGTLEYTLNSLSNVEEYLYECEQFSLIKDTSGVYFLVGETREYVELIDSITPAVMLELINDKFDYFNSIIKESIDLSATGASIEGKVGEYQGLKIDATNGKFADNNNGWVQVNAGTVITFNVPKGAEVSVVAYNNATNFAILNSDGSVTITCTGDDYLSSIIVSIPVIFDSNTIIDLSATGASIEGKVGEYQGLKIDATNGKFADNNSGWVQVNAGTVITFNVVDGASISLVAYSSTDNFTIVNENGIVAITCNTNDYLSSITISYE